MHSLGKNDGAHKTGIFLERHAEIEAGENKPIVIQEGLVRGALRPVQLVEFAEEVFSTVPIKSLGLKRCKKVTTGGMKMDAV